MPKRPLSLSLSTSTSPLTTTSSNNPPAAKIPRTSSSSSSSHLPTPTRSDPTAPAAAMHAAQPLPASHAAHAPPTDATPPAELAQLVLLAPLAPLATRCLACGALLPDDWWLGLHIGEHHDPLVGVRRGRGEKVNYDFQIVNTGIDRRAPQQRPRRRSEVGPRAWVRRGEGSGLGRVEELGGGEAEEGGGDVAEEEEESGNGGKATEPKGDDGVDALTTGLEALRFVPPSVRFGRGGRRGGLARS
ncbi:hypothetical protein MMC11_009050 [Xylographa trunciseda]|nr:hypothetical protein [Xylographa trunciseda]